MFRYDGAVKLHGTKVRVQTCSLLVNLRTSADLGLASKDTLNFGNQVRGWEGCSWMADCLVGVLAVPI